MTYRDDLQALVTRHNALDAELLRVKVERDALRSLIDDKQARLRLPVLDNVRVAAPCREDWAAMQGDARVRHCGRCNQNVYNLSEMTREEAESLLVAREGRLCVRYYRRKTDGTILTRNCPVGAQRRRRWWFGIGVVATIVGAVFGFLSASKRNTVAVGSVLPSIQDSPEVEDIEDIQGGTLGFSHTRDPRMGTSAPSSGRSD